MSAPVFAAQSWPTNAHLIADAARLGYLDGEVLDVTYGKHGGFWTVWRPEQLTTSDLRHPADHQWDFRALPVPDQSFDTVVIDADYKLSGTPALEEQDERYGVDENLTREQRMEKMRLGAIEGFRVCRRYLLVKCMDQVEGGRVRWQTDMVTRAVEEAGGHKVDRFDFLTSPRPQPGDRQQRTARRNYSTLLVFSRVSGLRRGATR